MQTTALPWPNWTFFLCDKNSLAKDQEKQQQETVIQERFWVLLSLLIIIFLGQTVIIGLTLTTSVAGLF